MEIILVINGAIITIKSNNYVKFHIASCCNKNCWKCVIYLFRIYHQITDWTNVWSSRAKRLLIPPYLGVRLHRHLRKSTAQRKMQFYDGSFIQTFMFQFWKKCGRLEHLQFPCTLLGMNVPKSQILINWRMFKAMYVNLNSSLSLNCGCCFN